MKLLVFAPCEKVILDNKGNPSLISLLSKVTIQTTPEDLAKIPPNGAVAPMTWYVFTHWLMEPSEFGREFVQRADIILPNNELMAGKGSSIVFKPTDPEKNISQNNVTVFGFPLGNGRVSIDLWVEENGQPVTEKYSYPLTIEVVAEQQPGLPAWGQD